MEGFRGDLLRNIPQIRSRAHTVDGGNLAPLEVLKVLGITVV